MEERVGGGILIQTDLFSEEIDKSAGEGVRGPHALYLHPSTPARH